MADVRVAQYVQGLASCTPESWKPPNRKIRLFTGAKIAPALPEGGLPREGEVKFVQPKDLASKV